MLDRGASQNQKVALAQSLIAKTKKLGPDSGLDVIVCTDLHQKGETFGRRLSNAINETFSKGYKQVIAIGSDTPQLSVKHISKAIEALKSQEVILGPSADGGVYLIGMHKSAFRRHEFENLPWLTNRLFSTFMSSFPTHYGESHLLETLVDIDDYHSLLAASKTLKGSGELNSLIGSLLLKSAFCTSSFSTISSAYFSTDYLRRSSCDAIGHSGKFTRIITNGADVYLRQQSPNTVENTHVLY